MTQMFNVVTVCELCDKQIAVLTPGMVCSGESRGGWGTGGVGGALVGWVGPWSGVGWRSGRGPGMEWDGH